mmetsp:Transcript_11074/g.28078  ORF Transcript_11074/g.28078 Transcript_11074/m.28078 type:complete len:222 (-) Transcript_11074:98-763(-)
MRVPRPMPKQSPASSCIGRCPKRPPCPLHRFLRRGQTSSKCLVRAASLDSIGTKSEPPRCIACRRTSCPGFLFRRFCFLCGQPQRVEPSRLRDPPERRRSGCSTTKWAKTNLFRASVPPPRENGPGPLATNEFLVRAARRPCLRWIPALASKTWHTPRTPRWCTRWPRWFQSARTPGSARSRLGLHRRKEPWLLEIIVLVGNGCYCQWVSVVLDISKLVIW